MKNIIYLLLILLLSCSNENTFEVNTNSSNSLNDFISPKIEIDINTTRSAWNILESDSVDKVLTRSSSDPFTEIRDVESSESIVLPELIPHIWVGNIMKISSIANCAYQPIIYPRNPIHIGLTLPHTNPRELTNPTALNYMSYVQEQMAKGSFSQSGEFNFTIEQFTSYNELKVAFGSNVNTSALFWGSSSSTEETQHNISRATGLYIKFYQTSFKAFMDYPQNKIAEIPSNMIDEAVYINSITYGRLGILTLETNYTAKYAKETINKTFKKLFVKGSSSLTTEEITFLNGCDFKVYLISGNGSSAVESFTGYDGFIQHIKKGRFSSDEPGSPLFCTFNHVKDNSPVKINFKFSIKKKPLYIELIRKDLPTEKYTNKVGRGDLYLYFYQDRSKRPTIAPPELTFKLKTTIIKGGNRIGSDTTVVFSTYKNAGYQTSILLMKDIYTQVHGGHCSGRPGDRECESFFEKHIYTIEDNENYVIVGKKKID